MSEESGLFTKIINREIPANIVYEDEHCIAFHDISPKAPVHVLLIPKQVITNLAGLQAEDQNLAGHMLLKIGHVARLLGIEENGYRVVANCGRDGGQSVDHLHFHIFAGRRLKWPPG